MKAGTVVLIALLLGCGIFSPDEKYDMNFDVFGRYRAQIIYEIGAGNEKSFVTTLPWHLKWDGEDGDYYSLTAVRATERKDELTVQLSKDGKTIDKETAMNKAAINGTL